MFVKIVSKHSSLHKIGFVNRSHRVHKAFLKVPRWWKSSF